MNDKIGDDFLQSTDRDTQPIMNDQQIERGEEITEDIIMNGQIGDLSQSTDRSPQPTMEDITNDQEDKIFLSQLIEALNRLWTTMTNKGMRIFHNQLIEEYTVNPWNKKTPTTTILLQFMCAYRNVSSSTKRKLEANDTAGIRPSGYLEGYKQKFRGIEKLFNETADMALHNHSRMDRLENFVENLKLQFSQRDDRGSKNNLMDGTSLNDDESGEIQPPMMRTSLVSHTRERPKSTYFKSSFERRPSLHSNRGGRGGQSGCSLCNNGASNFELNLDYDENLST
ncbi:hypothetical protein M9H77_17622 [Catharanthus roseus]|uniref:Uncharacterized protein n=1 Tax=Catharanthus roseus TaxID=4058 RepID=A0ACC0B549_CATRO|nr:hypothetical protein M9H77_17622 [Catharanthus roseus]